MKAYAFATLVTAVMLPGGALADPPLAEIRGHGIWGRVTGDYYENHQPYIDSTSVNAWVDTDGSVHGTIVWMDVFNGPYDDQGQGFSGYTWQIEVDTFQIISQNEVYVEGVVTHSQVKSDIGLRSGFYFYDGGSLDEDRILSYPPVDPILAQPILAGNVRIRM